MEPTSPPTLQDSPDLANSAQPDAQHVITIFIAIPAIQDFI